MEIVDTIVPILVTNIVQLLQNEVNLLNGVKDQVNCLEGKLPYMRSFLKDSEGNRENNIVRQLVDDIRILAGNAEDAVDKYVLEVEKQNRRNSLNRFIHGFGKITGLHDISNEIKGLENKIENIYKNYETFHIEHRMDTKESDGDEELRRQNWVQRHRNNFEKNVVGFSKEKETLVNQLIKGTNELDVISILGMGGLGKTTLARKVYKETTPERNTPNKNRFICHAWVSISQNFKLKELLIEIVSQVAPITEKMKGELQTMLVPQLKEMLKNKLSDNKYLVVLDDLWKKEDWDELKDVFPNEKNGSRVFITTRNQEVALQARKNPPLRLRFLNEEESWELFTEKVFGGESCPDNLVTLGEKIVKKCKGLPLAIVVVAGLLESKEKTPDQWDNMHKGVVLNLEQETPCYDVLGLSYKALPSHLKPCFLYLGLFPEDHKIPATKLIQLWISEGFIEREDDRELKKEDIAKNYLHQLIARSLIQVEEVGSAGGVKTCRVHDLIRDLCIRLSREEKFLETHDLIPSSRTEPRRLSVHHFSRGDYIMEANRSTTGHIRTLLFFSPDEHKFSRDHWKKLFKNFELLRVLDMGDREVQSITNDIKELILLKYLRVRTAPSAVVRASIYRLHNLQTLDLRCTTRVDLTEDIWSMTELRHLYLSGPVRLPKNPRGKSLFKLQTLCYVDPRGQVNLAEAAPNLRKLGLHCDRCMSVEDANSAFHLKYLESLKFVKECQFNERIQMPASLTSISVKGACVNTKTIQMFQCLSGLRVLKFDGVTLDEDKLVFGEDSFRDLEFLKIENSGMKSWKIEAGAAPKLNRVVIGKSDSREFPELFSMVPFR